MGVNNLNKLFARCQTEPRNKHHQAIIIDGSNLIFQSLASQLSNMKKGLKISQWDSIDADIIQQISFITTYAIEYISEILEKLFERDCEEVILVLDPLTTPVYTIHTSYEYNHDHEDLLDECLSSGEYLNLTIKSDEQEKRREAANKDSQIKDDIMKKN